MEESPVAPRDSEHASNGIIENTARELGKQSRVLKDSTESKYKTTLHTKHVLLAWMVVYAGELITRFAVDKYGRTPYELSMVKTYKNALVPFGGIVHYMPIKHSKKVEQHGR